MQRTWTLDSSLEYTRWLSTHHYENFHVVSVLLPKHLHQDFFNVYAFCRWSDDLGDEMDDPRESLRLLAWWRGELDRLYQDGTAQHPVFVALRETIQRRQVPSDPFSHLIDAFVQDQTVTRYHNWDGVLDYCVRSANPVGRLVLMLCGYRDEERFRLSDSTCTALQLANFWQDVTVDLLKDRVYLPLHLFEKHGYTEDQLFRREYTPAFRAVMAEAVDQAQRSSKRASGSSALSTAVLRWTSISSAGAACACSKRSGPWTTTSSRSAPPSGKRSVSSCCCKACCESRR